MVVAKNGPKLTPAGSAPETFKGPGGTRMTLADQLMQNPGPTRGSLVWEGVHATVNDLVEKLTEELQHPVTDATALTGKYNFTLIFRRSATESVPETDTLPDIFSALQSIGLRLDAAKRPAPVIVVDRIEKNSYGKLILRRSVQLSLV